uniref:Uncharacterized protein n=1 Tax=Knipowitschia caucasica TaxID=637954 RepID=A0AAV2MSU3_KNICA
MAGAGAEGGWDGQSQAVQPHSSMFACVSGSGAVIQRCLQGPDEMHRLGTAHVGKDHSKLISPACFSSLLEQRVVNSF